MSTEGNPRRALFCFAPEQGSHEQKRGKQVPGQTLHRKVVLAGYKNPIKIKTFVQFLFFAFPKTMGF